MRFSTCLLAVTAIFGASVFAGNDSSGTPIAVAPQRAFENLAFEHPIVITNANDGSDRLFVAEQDGLVHVFPNDADVEEPEVFLDIDKRCRYRENQNEEGLLGFAFHPDYKTNGELFVYYTTASEEHTSVISRFKVDPKNANKALADSEEVLMKIPQPYWNHNGGTIAFGPDGYLYIGLGDGGSGNDPHGNGQNLTTLLGSILRIDIDNKDEGKNYAIPADNPFIGKKVSVNRRGKKADACPEIYAYGLRNVWRLSFDNSGKLWAADVGQNLWEEINIIEKGGNYGWNIREAKHWFQPNGNDTDREDLVDPIHEYHHDDGKSITGGHVYTGKKVPALSGKYVYGDYVTGRLWALEYDGKASANHEIPTPDQSPYLVVTFGKDEAGEVYFATKFGQLYSFTAK